MTGSSLGRSDADKVSSQANLHAERAQRSQRVSSFWDAHAIPFIVAGGLVLGVLAGVALWHRGSGGSGGGAGRLLVDVLLIGLLVFGPIAVLGLALVNWTVGFLGGLFIVWAGSLLLGRATRRYGAKALAGDVVAQAKINGWKRWQKKWMR